MGFYEYRIVGNIYGYDVYTSGVSETRRDALIGAWFSLPRKEDFLQKAQASEWGLSYDDGSSWVNIQWDSWGASDVLDRNEAAAITATIGTHDGRPTILTVICNTGEEAFPGDVARFAPDLYDILLQTIYDEELRCGGVALDYPHYPETAR